MLNYTTLLTLLMQDIAARVPALSFIDMADVLVFARFGPASTAGSLASCHWLTHAPSSAGYYFWRDRDTGDITRRTEPFVIKAPVVTVDERQIKYLVSFTLPRFCDQSLARARKARFYRRAEDLWIAKLDTVVHELYHIAPDYRGIRRTVRPDGRAYANYHGDGFLSDVASMVAAYLDSGPDPLTYGFLQFGFAELEQQFGAIVGTTFKRSPSFPRPYREPVPTTEPSCTGVPIEAVKLPRQVSYAEHDLALRHFTTDTARVLSGDVAASAADGRALWLRVGPQLLAGVRPRSGVPTTFRRRSEDAGARPVDSALVDAGQN
jgi:hypothetical protein